MSIKTSRIFLSFLTTKDLKRIEVNILLLLVSKLDDQKGNPKEIRIIINLTSHKGKGREGKGKGRKGKGKPTFLVLGTHRRHSEVKATLYPMLKTLPTFNLYNRQ